MARPTDLSKLDTAPIVATWELWTVAQMLVSTRGDDAEIHAQAKLGVAYFKEIESYPTLRSAPNVGGAAEEVALERCQRTTTAF